MRREFWHLEIIKTYENCFLQAINFGGKSNVKKPDQTYSPASLLNMKEKGGSSKYQTCGKSPN